MSKPCEVVFCLKTQTNGSLLKTSTDAAIIYDNRWEESVINAQICILAMLLLPGLRGQSIQGAKIGEGDILLLIRLFNEMPAVCRTCVCLLMKQRFVIIVCRVLWGSV